ncbi:LysR family transcriptional regulator [Periweissella ghanensis]|uniref:HTH-type transcriptional regulator CysL n=1 Tax=Periweissella ghanensis TaxID=467997 RepID=A0ABN8BP44_9LACO|nr:LysR family transcriptional regulator [Periweissella ghanensis]MCM0601698.1 LysR family transcriptional regulator [Periweissella ghanensis]CAH0418385.1 HTH-type transcriptional regulator CysL [Periweissella ghanensis]
MFRLLTTFITVYETKNFSNAARQLFISQPTVSNHIQQLENHFDTQLFIRNGHSEVVPTEIARRIYDKALKIMADWEAVEQDVRTHSEPKIPFKIAVSHTTGAIYLPKILPFILAQNANFDIEIQMHNSDQVLELLSQHQIDMGLIEKPIVNNNVASHIMMHDQLVLAGDLGNNLWLVREAGSGVYHFTQQYFKANHLRPEKQVTIANNDIIVALLAAGIGKSIVSINALPKNIPYQELDETFNRNFYLLTSRDRKHPLIMNTINQIVSEFSL